VEEVKSGVVFNCEVVEVVDPVTSVMQTVASDSLMNTVCLESDRRQLHTNARSNPVTSAIDPMTVKR